MDKTGKRYGEADILRVVILSFLPLVHCYEEFHDRGYLSAAAMEKERIWLFLCLFGPSVFMTALGMNLAFSSHASPGELVRRGARTAGAGILLNLLRYILPAAVISFVMGRSFLGEALELSLRSDILYFAALAFLFFAWMKKRNVPPWGTLLIALALLSIHTLFAPESREEGYLTSFLGNFVHVTDTSAFPVLTWLCYPALGYVLGTYRRTLTEAAAGRFYLRLCLLCAAFLLVLCVTMAQYGIDYLTAAASPLRGYETDLFAFLLDSCVVGLCLAAAFLIHRLTEKRMPGLRRLVLSMSRGILVFYMVQWILVGWTEYLLLPSAHRRDPLEPWEVFLVGVGIYLVSAAVTLLTERIRKREKT